jgi:hypothetical protein
LNKQHGKLLDKKSEQVELVYGKACSWMKLLSSLDDGFSLINHHVAPLRNSLKLSATTVLCQDRLAELFRVELNNHLLGVGNGYTFTKFTTALKKHIQK